MNQNVTLSGHAAFSFVFPAPGLSKMEKYDALIADSHDNELLNYLHFVSSEVAKVSQSFQNKSLTADIIKKCK